MPRLKLHMLRSRRQCGPSRRRLQDLEGDYKTKYAYGPSRTKYRQKFRPQLLMGNAHDFFFEAKNRAPVLMASYSQYTSALFEKHFSVRVTTNNLRKCIVDYFLSFPERINCISYETLAPYSKAPI